MVGTDADATPCCAIFFLAASSQVPAHEAACSPSYNSSRERDGALLCHQARGRPGTFSHALGRIIEINRGQLFEYVKLDGPILDGLREKAKELGQELAATEPVEEEVVGGE